ncbi:TPA: hypothetical protein DD449_04405 [Candidatus Berkelbacteria bacterium]|uniref:Transcriptional regulator TrmB n=1 Tax=Berkelbacteria bacterium GW2011_GWE1_39_12 TaxID=1618337 RepID=A0A0G4B2Y5_9BACT|nr:MAG: transcriptional regulator TrmB [Berkelbacteria bacterium GW2011_GWE1_39_12]HBO60897.1 hypothetical protein [Candidatus Berkelbacteria bacterium]
MDINSTLKDLGLDEKEINIYLATLELGESTVLPIAKKAGLKRTYCYDILSSLQQKGLVYYQEKNNRRRYIAEDPKKLEEIAKNRLRNLASILPELKSLYNRSASKPKVRFYEGKSGLIEVYEMFAKAKSFDAIASPNHITENLGDYFKSFADRVIMKKLKIRELVTGDGQDIEYVKKYKKPFQEARILPQGVVLDTDIVIFEDNLALISYEKDVHAVLLQNSSIVKTHKVLFELLWSNARKL